MLTISEWA